MTQKKAQKAEYRAPFGYGPAELADGRFVAPGETVKLTSEEAELDHNKRQIDDGRLLIVDADGKES